MGEMDKELAQAGENAPDLERWLRELDGKLDAVSAVVEEAAVNQQILESALRRTTPDLPPLQTQNVGRFALVAGDPAAGPTEFFQTRGTFSWFPKCCKKTCKITIGGFE